MRCRSLLSTLMCTWASLAGNQREMAMQEVWPSGEPPRSKEIVSTSGIISRFKHMDCEEVVSRHLGVSTLTTSVPSSSPLYAIDPAKSATRWYAMFCSWQAQLAVQVKDLNSPPMLASSEETVGRGSCQDFEPPTLRFIKLAKKSCSFSGSMGCGVCAVSSTGSSSGDDAYA